MFVTGVLITVAVVSVVAMLGNAAIIGTGPKIIRHTPGGQLFPLTVNATLFVLSLLAIRFG